MLHIPSIPPALLKEWVSIANRTLIDEIDGFPALAVGEPPRVGLDQFGLIDFFLDRGGADWIFGEGQQMSGRSFSRRVSAEPRNGRHDLAGFLREPRKRRSSATSGPRIVRASSSTIAHSSWRFRTCPSLTAFRT